MKHRERTNRSLGAGLVCASLFCKQDLDERLPGAPSLMCLRWCFSEETSNHTPLKIKMKPKGLEDNVSFQAGDFQVPCLFSGVYPVMKIP